MSYMLEGVVCFRVNWKVKWCGLETLTTEFLMEEGRVPLFDIDPIITFFNAFIV
jgi:hypothetical protein